MILTLINDAVRLEYTHLPTSGAMFVGAHW